MAWFLGIDIGSISCKGAIAEDGEPKAFYLIPSGSNYQLAAANVRDELLNKVGLQPEDIAFTATTGHGADNVPFSNQNIADIRCCARGLNSIFPEARTVIDVQGQSSQVLRVNEKGQVANFIISERCATGSGRFMDIIAHVLQIKLDEIGPLSLKSDNPVIFTTGCAVFGESEVISRISEGVPKEDILAGVNKALADKLVNLANLVGIEEACAITGGGGLNIGLIKKLEERLNLKILVPPQPQLINALGATIIAREELAKIPEGEPLLLLSQKHRWIPGKDDDDDIFVPGIED